jgi:hypothetical protein
MQLAENWWVAVKKLDNVKNFLYTETTGKNTIDHKQSLSCDLTSSDTVSTR